MLQKNLAEGLDYSSYLDYDPTITIHPDDLIENDPFDEFDQEEVDEIEEVIQ